MAVPTGSTLVSFFGAQPQSHVVPPYYADFLREQLYPSLYFRQLGTLVSIPRANGEKVRIPRWQTPLLNTKGQTIISAGMARSAMTVITAVSEGNIITPGVLCAESITGKVIQFAGGRRYSDKLVIITKANFLEGALESLAREMAFKIDRYSRQNITANAFLARAGAGTKFAGAATTDGLFGKNVAKIAPYLDAANVPRWEDETFVGITNPLAQYDMYRDISSTGFVSVARYGDPQRIYRGEVGQMYGVRWLLSTAIPLTRGATAFSAQGATGTSAQKNFGLSAKATGTHAYIFAPDAFYSLELEDGGVEVFHMPPGSGGSTGDPAAQVGSVSMKLWYGVTPAPSGDSRLMRFAHGINLGY
jgi:N4-gp56 family major capsid protein